MLNNPGGKLRYNGQDLTYPDIKVIYWAGGNPFHHHQDLGRLRRAFARPETVILDAPATGHGVSWLAAPGLVSERSMSAGRLTPIHWASTCPAPNEMPSTRRSSHCLAT